jgi:hypothetical protein
LDARQVKALLFSTRLSYTLDFVKEFLDSSLFVLALVLSR